MSATIHDYIRKPAVPLNGKETSDALQESLDGAHKAFPYLEAIRMVAKKNPYGMLAAMIAVATIIVTAVTTFSIAVFTGAFLLYGKMSGMEVSQQHILEKLNSNEQEMKVLRTYESSVLSRQNYAVGLMDKTQQDRMNAYDKANPIPRLPDKPNKEN